MKQKGTMLQEHENKTNRTPEQLTNQTAGAVARTESKTNVACGKYPGKLNRNKYSTVKSYICFVNITSSRKSDGSFHGFKSMLNTNYINTFSEHTGSSVCYFQNAL